MRLQECALAAVAVTISSLAGPAGGWAQSLPLAPERAAGQSVTPAFEGWYRNPDGSYSLSFGYLNRNGREVLEIPIGPNNFMAPGDSNQGQPTRFEAQRHWGVFAIRVPEDFGDKTVTWTLSIRGETYSIPGSLKRGWEIDAIAGETASGNTPPIVKFDSTGAEGRGPGGIMAGPVNARVGEPLSLTVWASDPPAGGRGSGRGAAAGRGGALGTVALAWFKHQGPGNVTFSPASPRLADGKAMTSVTFSEPGAYILRLRATEGAGVASAGHAQCCWTNGFVKVTVSR